MVFKLGVDNVILNRFNVMFVAVSYKGELAMFGKTRSYEETYN